MSYFRLGLCSLWHNTWSDRKDYNFLYSNELRLWNRGFAWFFGFEEGFQGWYIKDWNILMLDPSAFRELEMF